MASIRVRVDDSHIRMRTVQDGPRMPEQEFHRMLGLYRSIPAGRFHRPTSEWVVPATVESARNVLRIFTHDELIQDEAFEGLVHQVKTTAHASTHKEVDPKEIIGAKTKPWRHQSQAFWFSRDLPATLLDMGMGTGKSKVVVDRVCEATAGTMQRVLILCPLSVVPVWPHEFLTHGWDGIFLNVTVLPPGLFVPKKLEIAKQAAKDWTQGALIIICNYDSAKRSPLKEWILKQLWDFVILDESHRIKSPGSKTSLFCKSLRSKALRRMCLTGTPMPHSPLDIYAQFRFLDPGIFGDSFTSFRARYAVLGGYRGATGQPLQILRFQNEEELAQKMEPLTFQARTEDVLDLPETMHVQRFFELGSEESRAYTQLEKQFIAEVKGGEVVASNALTKLIRLAQVAGGFARTQEGETIQIGASKKSLLLDVLEDIDAEEPIVVFCRFHEDLDAVHEVGRAIGRDVRELSGRRNELGGPIWRDGNGNLMAVQLQSGGVGIDLTRARYCIYYAVDYNLGNYEQSMARVHRTGQLRPVTYIHLVARGTIEESIYKSLQKKKNVVESILEQLK